MPDSGSEPAVDVSGGSRSGILMLVLLGSLVLCSGCDAVGEGWIESSGAGRTLWKDPGGAPPRRMLPVEWTLLWSRGSVDDTLFVRPLRMQGHPDGVYVLDVQAQRVLAFDRAGRLDWSFGSPGEGPGEFLRARDLRLGSGGEWIYVHDPDNGRITVLDRSGRLARMISTREAGRSETLVVLGDSLFVLATRASDDPFAVMDRSGNVRRRMNLPWEGFPDLPPLARQGTAATEGDRWVYGFLLGDGFFSFDGLDSLGYVGRYVEHTDFPTVAVIRQGSRTTRRLAERPVCSGCSLTLSDGILYVLFGGASPEHHRIVDLYRSEDGEYLGSYALPVPASWIHARGDRFYILADLPYPELHALELPEPPDP